MQSLTTELRNLRDTLAGLNNSVQENSDFVEQLAESNKQLIAELDR